MTVIGAILLAVQISLIKEMIPGGMLFLPFEHEMEFWE
jgi:hypothetical protein